MTMQYGEKNKRVVEIIKDLIWELGYVPGDVKKLTIKPGHIVAKLKSNDDLWTWVPDDKDDLPVSWAPSSW